MYAHVVLTNPGANRFAIRDRFGHYSILDTVRGALPDVGDLVCGAITGPGPARIVNLTKRQLLRVSVCHTGEKVAFRAKNMLRSPAGS